MKPLEALDLGQPLTELWPQFRGLRSIPMLIIRGANSDLLSLETFDAMLRRHPGADSYTVSGQGHAPLLIDPESIGKICDFAAKVDGKAGIS